eukprot:TRINITY_DN121737_c0_g1_i1.p1 TRINITY_DN121737_c0_g1~~TRINITY_DN121737_c0_g1_i1.p1  ORF type:complete len:331 (+),score=89.83 TRINITY_DN121737_c0_g1_i1:71-994(+)
MSDEQRELEARQEQEVEEMDVKCREHLAAVTASAGKGKKAKEKIDQAERECEQWRYEMNTRHEEEFEELAALVAGGKAPAVEAEEEDAGGKADAGDGMTAAEREAESIRKKKEKAAKKRQQKSDKEKDKREAVEREKAEAGPSARELELEAITARLKACKPRALRVHEVAADGHCLYRSIADQITRVRPDAHKFKLGSERAYEEVRSLCADTLRKDPDSYSPFAELADGEDFEGYCNRVENTACWGGELEIRALADALRVQVLVHRAEAADPLELGAPRAGDAPLQVAYHRHYYALGEHYNSVVADA